MNNARFVAFCPKCKFPLLQIGDKWKCPNCGREDFNPIGFKIKGE